MNRSMDDKLSWEEFAWLAAFVGLLMWFVAGSF